MSSFSNANMDCEEEALSNSSIQNVLSNPEVLQQLIMSQADGQTSDIQGIKIGDRVLPVRMYDQDGKKMMQIVIPEYYCKDESLFNDDIPDMNMSVNDSNNQYVQTIDGNYIEDLNIQDSLNGLPTQGDSMQETSGFIESKEDMGQSLMSDELQAIPSIHVYDNTAVVSSESQNYQVKLDPEILESLQDSSLKLQNEEDDGSIKLLNEHDYGSLKAEHLTSDNVTPGETYHHNQDIVAAAFEESGLLQATANVISAAKYHFKESQYKKRKRSKKLKPSETLYACNFGNCRQKFCNRIGLEIHWYGHTGLKPVTCKVCEKSFLTSKIYDKHKCKYKKPPQEMKGERFECDICSKSFGNIGTLFVHKRAHKGSKPYSCGLCSKSFTLKASMYKHVKSHGADVRYKCQTCDQMFKSPWHLEEHLMSHMNEKKVYNCTHCTKVFTNYANYNRHIKSHMSTAESENQRTKLFTTVDHNRENFLCKICMKQFHSKSSFQKHQCIQKKTSKRFQCTICKKLFATKDYLQNHLQWYIAKFALGQPVTCHTKLIEKYQEDSHLDVNHFLEMIQDEDEMDVMYDNFTDDNDSTKAYLCDICGNYFFTERALTRHIKFHNSIPYKCSYCDKKFSFRSNLHRHESTHKENKEFQCTFCTKMFSQKAQLEEHIATHSSCKPYPCNICNKKFARISNLRRHKQLHSMDKKFECPECNRRFVCARYLKEHVVNVHTSMGRKKQECPICKLQLSGNSNLNRHLNLHYGTVEENKKLECEYCGKKFEFQSDMEVHLRVHTGEKPFKCDKCDKAFMSMSNLRRHQSAHIDTKTHVCEICGKAFKIERYLMDHMKTHTNPVKVTCEICNLTFSSNTNMKRHKMIHSGEKPFSCSICDKSFRSKKDAERHQVIHFKEKTEQCKLCMKKFKHKELLRRHMEKHDRGVPTCNICNKEFATNYKLRRHQQIHQDNFICNVCNATFKTSVQLQKHVETHDISEMRTLLLNMGSIKTESPVKSGKKSVKMKHTGPSSSSADKKNVLKKIEPASITNLPLLAPKTDTSVFTVSEIPVSTQGLGNIISISIENLNDLN